MTIEVFWKLAAVFAVVALGWGVAKGGWLDRGLPEGTAARLVSNVAFLVFTPALLFRTTARIDFATLPWSTLAAFFGPVVGVMLLLYAWQRARGGLAPAAPAVRAITACFGNTVQLGIPLAAAMFGEAGLQVHVAIVSLHAVTLLTLLTALVEHDVARASAGASGSMRAMLGRTLRNTLIHPVVLPVLAGLVWNAAGLGIPAPVDEILRLLGQAVVPLCLLAIGLSLGHYGLAQVVGAAVWLSALKLLVLPAAVYAAGRWGAGLSGLPLTVIVLCAALPSGSNPLMFAQRYRTHEGETTGAIVLSTLGFVLTAPLWLALLPWLDAWR